MRRSRRVGSIAVAMLGAGTTVRADLFRVGVWINRKSAIRELCTVSTGEQAIARCSLGPLRPGRRLFLAQLRWSLKSGCAFDSASREGTAWWVELSCWGFGHDGPAGTNCRTAFRDTGQLFLERVISLRVGISRVGSNAVCPTAWRWALAGPARPFVLELQKRLAAALMIFQLGFQKSAHVHYTVDLRIFDVLHPAKYIVAGFLVFGLLAAQLFFDTKVLFLYLLYLGERAVVCQAPAVKLLASGLKQC